MDLISLGDSVLGPQRSFNGAGFVRKLSLLEENFGIATVFREEAESINKARTCLTHRLGRVTPKDVNDEANNRLHIKYRALELYFVNQDGTETTAGVGSVIEGPGSLCMRPQAGAKSRSRAVSTSRSRPKSLCT